MICKYCSYCARLSFHFLDTNFWCTRVFHLAKSHVSVSYCVAHALGDMSINPQLDPSQLRFTPAFSSKSFMILVLILRSLIHVQLIFACCVKEGSNFVSFHVVSSCLSTICYALLSLVNDLGILVKNQLFINVYVYFWTVNSIPSFYTFIFIEKVSHHFFYITYCCPIEETQT